LFADFCEFVNPNEEEEEEKNELTPEELSTYKLKCKNNET